MIHDGTRAHFSQNLRFLCGSGSSVSQACRHLDINRQQFARYLNGQYLPSLHNVHRICDFFGVQESEVFLPPEKFRLLMERRSPVPAAARLVRITQPEQPFDAGVSGARRYAGYWFRYLRSVEYPGAIIKAMVKICALEDRVRVKSIERLRPQGRARNRPETFKYRGSLLLLTDRLFIVEYDVLLGNAITETILYPTHKHPMTLLFGDAFGISSGAARTAYMTPIVYEFVGVQADVRAMIRACQLYDEGSPAVDDRIRRFLARREGAPREQRCSHA